MNNLLHWLFGHWWKSTWETVYYDDLEQQCKWCDKYRHRSCHYSDDPYLSSWRDGPHPYHPDNQIL